MKYQKSQFGECLPKKNCLSYLPPLYPPACIHRAHQCRDDAHAAAPLCRPWCFTFELRQSSPCPDAGASHDSRLDAPQDLRSWALPRHPPELLQHGVMTMDLVERCPSKYTHPLRPSHQFVAPSISTSASVPIHLVHRKTRQRERKVGPCPPRGVVVGTRRRRLAMRDSWQRPAKMDTGFRSPTRHRSSEEPFEFKSFLYEIPFSRSLRLVLAKLMGKSWATLVDLVAGESPRLNAATIQLLCELILIWSSLGRLV
jgi:hypothetical protein